MWWVQRENISSLVMELVPSSTFPPISYWFSTVSVHCLSDLKVFRGLWSRFSSISFTPLQIEVFCPSQALLGGGFQPVILCIAKTMCMCVCGVCICICACVQSLYVWFIPYDSEGTSKASFLLALFSFVIEILCGLLPHFQISHMYYEALLKKTKNCVMYVWSSCRPTSFV
mgnify:CR=1 FL=1